MDSRIPSNTSKSTGSARKITIKRVTSLPKDKKNELYNPFSDIAGDVSPTKPQKDQEDTKIYDPFEPTWSEEERNSPESDDWNPECPEKETSDVQNKVKNSENEISEFVELATEGNMKKGKDDPVKETTDLQIKEKNSVNKITDSEIATQENREKGKGKISQKSVSAKIDFDVQSDKREKGVDNIWSPEDLENSEKTTEKVVGEKQSKSPTFTPKDDESCEFDDIVDMYLDDQLENDTKGNIKKVRAEPRKDDNKSSKSGASPEKYCSHIKTPSKKHKVDEENESVSLKSEKHHKNNDKSSKSGVSAEKDRSPIKTYSQKCKDDDDNGSVSLERKKHHKNDLKQFSSDDDAKVTIATEKDSKFPASFKNKKRDKRNDSKNKFSSDDNLEISITTEKDGQSLHGDKKNKRSKRRSSDTEPESSKNSDFNESIDAKQNSDKVNADLEDGEIFDAKHEKISKSRNDEKCKNSEKKIDETISESRESASKSHKHKRKKSHDDFDEEREKSRHKKSKRRSRERVDSDKEERREKERKGSSFDDSSKKKGRDRRDSDRDKRKKRDRSDRDKSESRDYKDGKRSSRERDRRKRSHGGSDREKSESRGRKAEKRSSRGRDRRKSSRGDSDQDKSENSSSRDQHRRRKSRGDSDRDRSSSRGRKAEKRDKRSDDRDSHRDKEHSKLSSSRDKSRNSSERGRSHRRKSHREQSPEPETKIKSEKSKSSKDSNRRSSKSKGTEILHETTKVKSVQRQRMSFGSWDGSDDADNNFFDDDDRKNHQSLHGPETESFHHKRKESNEKSRSPNRDTPVDHAEAKHSKKSKHKHKRSKRSASPGSTDDQSTKKHKKRHKKKRHDSVSSEDQSNVNRRSSDESHVLPYSFSIKPDDEPTNPTNVAENRSSDSPIQDLGQGILGDDVKTDSDQELAREQNAEIVKQKSSPTLSPSKSAMDEQDEESSKTEKSPLKQETPTTAPDVSPPSELNEASPAHQSIKESLSFAEEFVERSRMRWKEKKSSVASSNESPQLCVLSDSESKTNHRNFTDADHDSGKNAQTYWNGKSNTRIPGLDIAESPVNDTDFRTCDFGTPSKPTVVDIFEDSRSVGTPHSQSNKMGVPNDKKCSATKESLVEYSPSDMILDSENSDSVKMGDFDADAETIAKENEANTKKDQVEDATTMQQTMLNPTQILNSIGLNPQQHSAAQNAILSIAELSKHLSLDKHLNEKTNTTSDDTPLDGIESSAVELYNKDKKRGHMKRLKFREKVIEEAKSAIKPYYERRQITKTEYKDILKKAVNKIYNTELTYEVNTVKIRRLIRRYIEKYQGKHSKKKDKSSAKDQASKSPPAPQYQPLTSGVDSKSGVSSLLPFSKRETRKLYTLPDLQLPPPPPPPKR